jgi:hypothetical protein
MVPYLQGAGWTPTVLTVDPRDLADAPDASLAARLPADLDVQRVRAVPVRAARRVGFGDLGLRAYVALRRAGDALLSARRYDAVLVTAYPTYPALLLPRWRFRHGVAAVLDLQDPWVGAWGDTVGPAPGGLPDRRARVSRAVAVRLERRVLRLLDGASAVSRQTLEEAAGRVPHLRQVPWLEAPIGSDPGDIAAALAELPVGFAAGDGLRHIVYVGTLLPRAVHAMRAVFDGLALWRTQDPAAHDVRVHCVGTSNQGVSAAVGRAMDLARASGVADVVTEHPARVAFDRALSTLRHADGVLIVGSDEPHYTASKLYPALLADRPLMAVLHPDSQAATVLAAARGAAVVHVPLGTEAPDTPTMAQAWRQWMAAPRGSAGLAPLATPFLGPAIAQRFGALLSEAVAHRQRDMQERMR